MLRPDDITDEEYAEFERGAKHVSVRYGLVGLNALRDERVRADERERIAGTAASLLAAAIREGGQQ